MLCETYDAYLHYHTNTQHFFVRETVNPPRLIISNGVFIRLPYCIKVKHR